jgi:trimethylamine:corrinoid methyltransferase-like protein
MSHDRWLETGGLDLTEKARRKAREIVATHEVPPLTADLVARIDAAIAGL